MSSSDDEAPLAVPLQASAAARTGPDADKDAAAMSRQSGGIAQAFRQAPEAGGAQPASPLASASAPPVPVTLITGYLGAGKTTLVNYILTAKHGYRCAVLLNEIADSADIERALVKEPEGADAAPLAEWTELENGCICCSAKNDMVKALESLMQQRSRFDYVLIETTGLANPGPVAAALWTDEQLESSVCLDCIVTVVDARNIPRQLTDPRPEGGVNEAQQQVAFADVVLLNKTDLASEDQLRQIEADIRSMNAASSIIRCQRCHISLDQILNTGIYSQTGAAQLLVAGGDGLGQREEGEAGEAGAAAAAAAAQEQEQCGDPQCSDPAHHHNHQQHHEHSSHQSSNGSPVQHDSRVGTVTIPLPGRAVDLAALRHWLDCLLWEETAKAVDVFRIKGLLNVAGSCRKHVLQGVHELYDIVEGPKWVAGEARGSKLVFIGRRLQRDALLRGLQACLADGAC